MVDLCYSLFTNSIVYSIYIFATIGSHSPPPHLFYLSKSFFRNNGSIEARKFDGEDELFIFLSGFLSTTKHQYSTVLLPTENCLYGGT